MVNYLNCDVDELMFTANTDSSNNNGYGLYIRQNETELIDTFYSDANLRRGWSLLLLSVAENAGITTNYRFRVKNAENE